MNLCSFFARLAIAAALFAGAAPSMAADPAADAMAVRHVLMSQFDKPEERLSVEPVVVSGDAAVASWAQGERGGRALLFRHGKDWQIAICAGDALKDAKVLQESGVKPADAKTLVSELVSAEAKSSAAQRAKFASFDGFLRMDAHGQHPPAHKH